MRIIFYLQEPYPNGMACTKRIHLYAKGLIECKNDVKVIIPRAYESIGAVKNSERIGKFEGVHFEYSSNSTIRSSNFFIRRIQDILAFVKSIKLIREYKADVVLLIGNSFVSVISLFLFAKIYSWKLIREKSEVPFYKKDRINRFHRILLKFMFQFHDGFIVISNLLKDFFESELNLKRNYKVIPILVDELDEFREYPVTNNIVYTGSLLDKKDGIIKLIKAFALAIESFPDLQLIMTGDLNKSRDKGNILQVINELGLENKTSFTGFISEKELRELTFSAKILILAKPKNRQNKYNSATKVGEYLLSGRPVILSNVDTSNEVLVDNVDVFLTEPTVKAISVRIIDVISNYEAAVKVGLKGRKTALDTFGYVNQSKKIYEFLKSII